jgi:2-polyprenyl-6-methoxyphenol hydroxylase-like FAD-dependent oxidoreductase
MTPLATLSTRGMVAMTQARQKHWVMLVFEQHSTCEQDKALKHQVVLWRSSATECSGMIVACEESMPEDTAFLERAFGHVLPAAMIVPLSAEFTGQRVNSFGRIVSCSSFHAPGSVVLVGDAAHAITSSLGQGCNSALESVGVLGELMESAVTRGELSLADVPAAFTAARVKDIRALQRMEQMSVIAQAGADSSTTWVDKIWSMVFVVTVLVGMAQWKLLPSFFSNLPLFKKINNEFVHYEDVLGFMYRTAASVLGAMVMVFALVVSTLCRGV